LEGTATAHFSSMTKRFPLDSVDYFLRKICFTLVQNGPVFYVERYVESPLPLVHGKMKRLMFSDCVKHDVNGVPLMNLVLSKMRYLSWSTEQSARLN
jgi:hypothetical protein